MNSLLTYLEQQYQKYNHREFVSPDPLEYLYGYKDQRDIEIMGLVASSLAYGRVKQILNSIEKVENIFNKRPYQYISNGNIDLFYRDFSDFKHRTIKGETFAKYLNALRIAFREYGTIENLFMSVYKDDIDLHATLNNFYLKLSEYAQSDLKHIFPNPSKKSACKRSYLFLRWMIRKDEVDLGIWDNSLKSKLLIPLDTHILNVAESLGLINNRSGISLNTARLITEEFRRINPSDPVKYDFTLTRPGIRNENEAELLSELQKKSLTKLIDKFI